MTVDILSDLLLLPVAILCWRLSRILSSALQFAFIAAMALRLGIEEARIASLATGLAGAIDMGFVLDDPKDLDRELRRALVGAILMASMCVDFAAYVANRIDGSWAMPVIQIGTLIVIGKICWRVR
jgi:hypothetical protein